MYFIAVIFAWNLPVISPVFLKRSLVFPILLFSSISLHCSLKKAFLSLLDVLWNSAFSWVYLSLSPLHFASLVFLDICKTSSGNHFAFLHFFFLAFGHHLLYNVTNLCPLFLRHSIYQIWIYLSSPQYNYKGFDLGHTESFQFSSVAQLCPTLCDPMNCSTPGLPVHHQLPKSTQTHVHWIGDAIQPSHPLSSPSPPALNLSQHQGLF